MATTTTAAREPERTLGFPSAAEMASWSHEFMENIRHTDAALDRQLGRVSELSGRESEITFAFVGAYTAFVHSVKDDLGELLETVSKLEGLVGDFAMSAEFEGPDSK